MTTKTPDFGSKVFQGNKKPTFVNFWPDCQNTKVLHSIGLSAQIMPVCWWEVKRLLSPQFLSWDLSFWYANPFGQNKKRYKTSTTPSCERIIEMSLLFVLNLLKHTSSYFILKYKLWMTVERVTMVDSAVYTILCCDCTLLHSAHNSVRSLPFVMVNGYWYWYVNMHDGKCHSFPGQSFNPFLDCSILSQGTYGWWWFDFNWSQISQWSFVMSISIY